jgi:hypothetical protein
VLTFDDVHVGDVALVELLEQVRVDGVGVLRLLAVNVVRERRHTHAHLVRAHLGNDRVYNLWAAGLTSSGQHLCDAAAGALPTTSWQLDETASQQPQAT